MNENGKVILSALAGVAIGAALGVLFAPGKGKDTRNKISKKAADFAENAEEQFKDFVDTVKQKFEDVKEKTSENIKEETAEKVASVNNL